jgi:hypothetical protein
VGQRDGERGALFLKSISGRLCRAMRGSLAAQLDAPHSTEDGNPAVGIHEPDPAVRTEYDELCSLYREPCTSTTATVHALAVHEKRTTRPTTEEPR